MEMDGWLTVAAEMVDDCSGPVIGLIVQLGQEHYAT
jgi:hypothetical protein